MSRVAKDLDVILLFDFYGEMLTDKQQSFIDYYYNNDLSLSEIAKNEGITRQGVRDAIKRAEAQLFYMEERLGYAKQFDDMRTGLDMIIDYANEINEYNQTHVLSREISDTTIKIKTIAQALVE